VIMQNMYMSNIEWYDAGLKYALKSWSNTFNRLGSKNLYKRIEKISLGIVAELAVEQYLKDNKIPYSTKGRTKWYEEDRYDIGIGEYAIDVKANIIDVTIPKIARTYDDLLRNPNDWLSDCVALVPEDQFNPGNNKKRSHELKKKAYVFVFMYPIDDDLFIKNIEKYIHAFWDYRWLQKGYSKDSTRSGKLSCNIKDGGIVRIFGTSSEKEIVIEDISMKSSSSSTSKNCFFQVFSALWLSDSFPESNLTIRMEGQDLVEVIEPYFDNDFRNCDNGIIVNNWYPFVYNDLNIVLAGWMTDDQMRLNGFPVPRFSHNVKQYPEIKVDNYGVKVSDLNNIIDISTLVCDE